MTNQNIDSQQDITFDKSSYLKSLFQDVTLDKEVIDNLSNLTSLLRPSIKNNKTNKKGNL